MNKLSFTFLLFCILNLHTSQSLGQGYPLTPDEVGLVGAGVSYDDLTVWPTSGEVYLTTGVYEMYDFQNCNIVINGDDVVLRKCRVTWNGNNLGVIRTSRTGAPHAGLVIEDCELNGQGDVNGLIADAGIWPGRFTMIRTWIYNIGNDIAKITDGVTIHRCYLGPVFFNPGAHSDILQTGSKLYGSEPDPKQIITYNTFHGYHYVTGENINGGLLIDPFYDAVIVGNWFRGCGYHLHLHTDSANNGISHKVLDNVFENDFKFFYAYSPDEPHVNYEWYNNRFSDGSLAPIPGTTILEGSGGTVPDIPYTTYDSNVEVTGVSVSTNLNLTTGTTKKLSVTVQPIFASDKSVAWSSSNTSVATVDANGEVTGIGEGNATITVTTNDGGFTADCSIIVSSIPSNQADHAEGYITRDFWTDLSGMDVPKITNNKNFPDNPSGSDVLSSLEAVDWADPDVNSNWGDLYGQRIYGYLYPPVTGNYTFWIASDDQSDLYLSTDSTPENKVKIAYVDGHTGQKDWDAHVEQKSNAIALIAGQKYFIEVLHKENTGGDHVAVGWAKPGEDATSPSEIVPGKVLSPSVVVPDVPVSSVKLEKSEIQLALGQKLNVNASVLPINAADKSVNWESSDNLIATVDDNGTVKAMSVGDATITVTTNDGDFTAECMVSVSEGPANEGHLYINNEDGTVVENRTFTSVHISNSKNITVRNCKVIFNKDMGSVFKISDESSNIAVENCEIDGIDNACAGMDLMRVSDIMISNCDIHHLADDGLSIHYCRNITLQDNKIHHLIAKGTDGLVDGPCYNGHSDGIELNDVHYLYMYRNIIYDVYGTSCFMAGSHEGLYPSNLVLENNIFVGNGVGFVVYFGNVNTVRAYNNIIYNGIYGGLAFNGENTDIDFKNNICQAININHYGG